MKVKMLLLFCFLVASVNLEAQLRIPRIFSNDMVLQRDKPVTVWGWAGKGSVVTVSFNGQVLKGKSDGEGKWQVVLKPMSFGGPFEMTIKDKSGSQTLRNILIGDVWFCSGQSNMEMPIQGWNKDSIANAGNEIKSANYPQIRLFTVEKSMAYAPAEDVKGGQWQVCSPQTVGAFSATAFFFGRKLNTELNIPVGLINSTWGGTNIQAWTSWEEMSKLDRYKQLKMEDVAALQKKWTKNIGLYNAALNDDPGIREKWHAPETNTTSWKTIAMPVTFEQSEIGNTDGIVWYRKEIDLTETQANATALLSLGAIDDWDETYVNGTLVGKTNLHSEPRRYTIPSGILKPGANTVVVKVRDTGGYGGFTSQGKEIFLRVGKEQIPMAGSWMYKASVTTTQFDVPETGPNAFPSQLYNAMVAPMIKFPVKGAIWYQGESNAGEAFSYRSMFPTMINDWRSKWNDDFPFLWVQLASFMQPVTTPSESQWAELREAQHMTLNMPRTGEAVAIDIGEANDIHPKNKQDVGYRLALSALKTVYNKPVVHAGPVFESMEIKGNVIELTFSNIGTGLIARGDKYGYLKGFAIAGADHKFVWAKATIEGNKVFVTSAKVTQPVAVRYAWADNPDDANLFNEEGLPASPFRTDRWKGITEK
jgi:sialate O-acetylesterase